MTRKDERSESVEPQAQSSAIEEILAGFQLASPLPSEETSLGGDAVPLRPADPDPPRTGRARYLREGEIGRGGMGTILRVFDQHLRRRLAMKVTHARARDPGAPAPSGATPSLARFLEEAQITSQLEHPGVVPVHELGVDEKGQVFFTMRLIRGSSLKEILPLVKEQRDGWSLTRALGVLLKVCETMSYAHDRGVIHRDLKPANVMVGRYGEVYVMDWGLARVVGRADLHDLRPAPEDVSSIHTDLRELRESDEESPLITCDGSVLGTPAYMSPEQAAGQVAEVDRRSDVYTVGAMLYHLLTGQPPYVRAGARLSPHTILALVLNAQPVSVLKVSTKVPSEIV
jgi:serine/threonine-protein kinase